MISLLSQLRVMPRYLNFFVTLIPAISLTSFKSFLSVMIVVLSLFSFNPYYSISVKACMIISAFSFESARTKISSANAIKSPDSIADLRVGLSSKTVSKKTLKSKGDKTLPCCTPYFGMKLLSPKYTF